MIRLRIQELIEEVNRRRRGGESAVHIRDVAASLGVARSTLVNVTTFTGQRATNTRLVEALIRYFTANLRGFEIKDLFEFEPPLGQERGYTMDVLYPDWVREREERLRNTNNNRRAR